MSVAVGQDFLDKFANQIGLTAEEIASLAFFRSGFAEFQNEIFNSFSAIEDIELKPGLIRELLSGTVDVSTMAAQYEVGGQVVDNWINVISAFDKILIYMRANFDYEIVNPPEAYTDAIQRRFDAADPDTSAARLLSVFGDSLLSGVEGLALGVPAGIALAKLTFLKAADELVDKFVNFTEFVVPDFLPSSIAEGIDEETAQRIIEIAPVLYKLFKDIVPAIWDMATGVNTDPSKITGVIRTLNVELDFIKDAVGLIRGADIVTNLAEKTVKMLDLLDDLIALEALGDSSSTDSNFVITAAFQSRTANVVETILDVAKALSEATPGVDGSVIGDVFSLLEALASGIAGAYAKTRFDELLLLQPNAEEVFQSSRDVFLGFQIFINSVEGQIGITEGVTEALAADMSTPAPEFITESDVQSDNNDDSVVEIDVADTGRVTYEIIGGLDSDLFVIDEGRIVFISEEARLTPDANGDNIYDVLVQATNASGVSSQRAFQLSFAGQTDPEPDTESIFVNVATISAAETIEGEDLVFTVQLSDLAPRDITINYRMDLNSAERSDVDSVSLTGSITISEGLQSGQVNIPTSVDIDSDSEALSVTLIGASGGVVLSGNLSAIGMIQDSVGAPDLIVSQISIDRTTIDHDGMAMLTVSIRNIGDAPAEASLTNINMTDASGQIFNLGAVITEGLAAGESTDLSIRIGRGEVNSNGVDAAFIIADNVVSGPLIFNAFVDSENTVLESTGSNNSQNLTGVELSEIPVTASSDLVVSNFNLITSNVQSGELVTFEWTITNTGTATAPAANHGLFISETFSVSASDQRLQVVQTNELAAGESQSGQGTALISTLLDLDTGEYKLALIADVPFNGLDSQVSESDEFNNISSLESLLIGDTPNVGASGLTFSTTEFLPGARVTVTLVVSNDSPSKSFAGTARFVLSTDETIGANDQNLTFITVPELNSGETRELTATFFVPEGTVPGDYYAGVFIENVPGDTNPLDNVLAPVRVTVPDAPEVADGRDLTFSAFDWGVPSIELGGTPLSVSFTVTNQGDAATFNGGAVTFYASADAVLSDNDVPLNASFGFTQLEAGESQNFSVNVSANSNVGIGDVYIIAVINPGPGQTSFGTLLPNDDDLTNNSSFQLVSVLPAGDGPPDGELVPEWVDGAPASGTWVYEVFGKFGTRYDIDWDGGIRTGLGAEIRGDGGFGKDAYRWQGFNPESAFYDQSGRGLIFEGTTNGLDATREVFVTEEGGEFVRFLDTVTNNTDEVVEFTFAYALSIDLIRGSQVNFYDDISGNPAESISNTHTFIAGYSSDANGPVLGPSWSWSVGQKDFFTSDIFERSPIGDRFYLERTIALNPGESASFLQFGDHSSRIDGAASNWSFPISEDAAAIEREFFNGRLEGLTPEDLQNVFNFDVAHLILPADLSLTSMMVNINENGVLSYDGNVTNLGSLLSTGASLELILSNLSTSNVTNVPLALLSDFGGGDQQAVSGSIELSQIVVDGNYTAQIRVLHANDTNDANTTNDVFNIDGAFPVNLFTEGDDIVTLTRSGIFDAGAGDDNVVGTDLGDEISGNIGSDIIFGRGGDDIINDGSSNNAEEENYFYGDDGDDTLTGNIGNDLLDGGIDNDQLFGLAGNDQLRGQDGIDLLEGGLGNDLLEGGAGADILRGGDGRDRADYISSNTGVFVSLLSGETFGGHAEGDLIIDIEDLGGSQYIDVLIGDNQDNRLFGRSGNDLLNGGLGADEIDGGDGFDFVDYRSSVEGVEIALSGGRGNGGDAEGDRLFQIEGIYGSEFQDVIIGDRDDNHIEAGNGDDLLLGGDGSDRLDGGGGEDTIDYLTSSAAVTVSLASGRGLSGDALGDIILNVENISGSAWDDLLIGDDVDNYLLGRQGDDTLIGGLGSDFLIGGLGKDNLQGGLGNDTLHGAVDDDILTGDQGNDTLNGGAGNDTLDGGAGDDSALYIGSAAGFTVTRSGGVITVVDNVGAEGTDTLTDIERLTFAEGTFTPLFGTAGNDVPGASTDADLIYLLGGDDKVNASNGDDFIFGSDGNDQIIGGNGADFIDGGDGTDQARYANSNGGVTVDLGAGTASGNHAQGDTLVNIEDVFGSRFDDMLTGDAGDNVLTGFNGNDTLTGGDGVNTLLGGNGDDTFIAGEGADFHNGGGGFGDTIDYSGSTAGVQARLGGSQIFDGGYATGDSFQGIENLIGSDFNDTLVGNVRANVLTGNDGNDFINADRGNDTLLGGAGNDTLIGGFGQDTLNGGDGIDTVRYANANSRAVVDLSTGAGTAGHSFGDMLISIENLFGSNFNDVFIGDAGDNTLNGWNGVDRLTGGEGNDTLIGGAGNDRFIFTDNWDNDTVTDFEDGADLLDFRLVSGVGGIVDLTIVDDGSGNAVISFGSDSVTLTGIDVADITAADFLF